MVKEYVRGTGVFTCVSELSHATVHKTQKSEFSSVLLILPDVPHSLLSRDLLYRDYSGEEYCGCLWG